MKKSYRGSRMREHIFHVTFLSYGLVLYSEAFMLEDNKQTEMKREHS